MFINEMIKKSQKSLNYDKHDKMIGQFFDTMILASTDIEWL